MVVETHCQVWIEPRCCPCAWLEHTAVEGERELAIDGVLAVCRVDCDRDEAHRYREGRQCGVVDVSQLVPTWSHERRTGHAFEATEGGEGG